MRIAVIDDEKHAREELVHYILENIPDAEIEEVASGEDALVLLGQTTFDVLFIDVHLCDILGTTVASVASKLMPNAKIIFATAFSEYAVKAFELGVDNYLLKPFDPKRIAQILQDCQKSAAAKAEAAPVIKRLPVTVNRHTLFLDIESILYIETAPASRQCILHTADKEYYSAVTLGEYEQQLESYGFFRIHKSCLVQLGLIQDIFPWQNSGYALRLKGCSETLPIGRERMRELRARLSL